MLSGVQYLVMSSISVCQNPCSPPQSQPWATGTKGRYCIMSVHRVLCVSAMSPSHGRQSDSNVSPITPHSVSFHSVTMLHQSEVTQLITQHNQTLCTAQPYVFHRTELSCVKQKNMKLQNTKTTYKSLQKNKGNLPLVPYCTSQHPKVSIWGWIILHSTTRRNITSFTELPRYVNNARNINNVVAYKDNTCPIISKFSSTV
jgi:hypothetical protein